jgi:uncharacterized membrane protein YtjA (UPF0391 family)
VNYGLDVSVPCWGAASPISRRGTIMYQYAVIFFFAAIATATFGYMGVHKDISRIARPLMCVFIAASVGSYAISFMV